LVAPPVGAQERDLGPEARIARAAADLRPGRDSKPATLAERLEVLRVPGVSVCVVDGGRIAWARGFGVVAPGGEPVQPETLFQAASCSKPVAALGALRLVAAGKLALDEDVNPRLGPLAPPASEHTAGKPVTLRRLLCHRAGLTVHGFPGYAVGEAIPSLEQIVRGEKPANTAAIVSDAAPDSRTQYSGGGYCLVQRLVSEAAEAPFPEALRSLVLGPAGMTRSTFEQPLPEGRHAEAARGHQADGKPVPGGWRVHPEQAAAGLWTTPTDLMRLALALAAAFRGEEGALLPAALARDVLGFQSAEEKEKGQGFGLGLQLSRRPATAAERAAGHEQVLLFHHGGSNVGFKCHFGFAPALGRGLALMTNGDQGGRLIGELAAAIQREYGWE
ncbi:MAG: beta-lactamase family protein, partial [Planctomycetales bacterium]|nr:beta-lactamase family protein [Planctomycetales bacterium]